LPAQLVGRLARTKNARGGSNLPFRALARRLILTIGDSFDDDKHYRPAPSKNVTLIQETDATLPGVNARALLSFVGSFPTGCIVVDRNGRVLHANALAERTFKTHDVLWVNRGLLCSRTSDAALKRVIRTTSEAGRDPCVLRLDRGKGPPVYLRAFLIRSAESDGSDSVLLLLSDLAERLEPDRTALRRLFKLTQTETSLAVCLVRGQNIAEAAKELRITVNTARGHLKNLFQKAGVSRQAELIIALMCSPIYGYYLGENISRNVYSPA
jgi:DNA-binding CsgD family transcriptional regulator